MQSLAAAPPPMKPVVFLLAVVPNFFECAVVGLVPTEFFVLLAIVGCYVY